MSKTSEKKQLIKQRKETKRVLKWIKESIKENRLYNKLQDYAEQLIHIANPDKKVRVVVMEDTLDSDIAMLKEYIIEDFFEYLDENPEIGSWDEYYQSQGADRMNEHADSLTPIYYCDIDSYYYLYGDEIDENYTSNFGDERGENYKQAGICYFLESKGYEFFRELEDIVDDFINEGDFKTDKSKVNKLKKLIKQEVSI